MSDKNIHRFKVERHKWPDEIREDKRKQRNRILIVLCGVALFVGGFFAGFGVVKTNNSGIINASDSSKLDVIKSILKSDWYFAGEYGDSIDDALMDKALNGMVDNEWDPHTSYLSAEQMEAFSSSLSGHFVGIGVQYYDMGEKTYIISNVFKDSPAESAGILAGDQIYKVDGKLTNTEDIDTVSEWVKGEEGSDVDITVLREGKEVELTATRGTIASSVFYEIKDKVGILEITSFADTTAEDTKAVLEKFKSAGVDKIIIDLRNNGGGYLDTAQKLASLFVPSNSVTFQEKYSNGSTKEFMTNRLFKQYTYEYGIEIDVQNILYK